MPTVEPAVLPLFGQHIDAAAQTAALYPRIRYMGSKYKLLPHLAEVFAEVGGQTALDAFSGSGVVSYLLKRQGFTVTANDMLGFPGVLTSATVVNNSTQLTAADVARITGPAADDRDFVRKTFTGVFFTPDDLTFIDSAWSHISTMNGDKRAIAISALILSAARKQPRGVFTISGDLSNYDDGRRDLHLSMRDHFIDTLKITTARCSPGNRHKLPGRKHRKWKHERMTWFTSTLRTPHQAMTTAMSSGFISSKACRATGKATR
jgi:adenine-specific DNA-methyltransferase